MTGKPTCIGLALFLMIAVLSVSSGCESGNSQTTPRGVEARGAVERALTAWRDGKPYDQFGSTPPVRVVDSAWRGGETIESFEIVDEEGRDDGTMAFSVKLVSNKAKKDRTVKFVVQGQDPFWVYREEDYRRMLQTERNSVAEKAKGKRARRGG